MAINPVTIKAIVKVATTAIKDEKVRHVIFIACLIPSIIILLVLASPFAIFFSVTSNETVVDRVPITEIMNTLQDDFNNTIVLAQQDDSVDEIHTIFVGSEDNSMIDNSADVLMVFSAKYNVANENAEQMAVLTENQIKRLKDVFSDMNTVRSEIDTIQKEETYTKSDSNGKTITNMNTVTKKIKTIYVECLGTEDMALIYDFNDVQFKVLDEMKRSGYEVIMEQLQVE